jgi:hypothetical protein
LELAAAGRLAAGAAPGGLGSGPHPAVAGLAELLDADAELPPSQQAPTAPQGQPTARLPGLHRRSGSHGGPAGTPGPERPPPAPRHRRAASTTELPAAATAAPSAPGSGPGSVSGGAAAAGTGAATGEGVSGPGRTRRGLALPPLLARLGAGIAEWRWRRQDDDSYSAFAAYLALFLCDFSALSLVGLALGPLHGPPARPLPIARPAGWARLRLSAPGGWNAHRVLVSLLLTRVVLIIVRRGPQVLLLSVTLYALLLRRKPRRYWQAALVFVEGCLVAQYSWLVLNRCVCATGTGGRSCVWLFGRRDFLLRAQVGAHRGPPR